MYLEDRRSLVLNHNPFIAFNFDPNEENNHQVRILESGLKNSVKECVGIIQNSNILNARSVEGFNHDNLTN